MNPGICCNSFCQPSFFPQPNFSAKSEPSQQEPGRQTIQYIASQMHQHVFACVASKAVVLQRCLRHCLSCYLLALNPSARRGGHYYKPAWLYAQVKMTRASIQEPICFSAVPNDTTKCIFICICFHCRISFTCHRRASLYCS